jgi:TolB-like protein/Tfp pilus assembly protein PilF
LSAPRSKLLASLAELKRRKVFRTGVGYLIAAFALLQALSSVSGAIDLSASSFRLIIIGILAGFPLTLFLAWAYDLGPGGIERTVESTERGSPRWLELSIIGVLTVVVGGIGYAIYRPDSGGGGSAPRAAIADKSIAVLPFVNLSGDQANEYFGDGLAEELLNVLAKVPDLRVAARTSSFAYKGRNEDVRRIGNELNVATVLEGSVRKSGDKVRVTVQLINVADGYHLWSQNYDRTLNDIFTIQDEIAAAIADALKVTLLGQTASAATGTRDVSAYDLYLLGRHNMQSRTEAGLLAAVGYFERALEVDPNYAKAWSGLADAYNLLTGYGNLTPGKALPRAEQAARKALALDPNLAEAHASLGLIQSNHLRAPEAEAEFKRAIELDPDYAPAHVWYGTLLDEMSKQSDRAGKADLAAAQRAAHLAEYERALALDPSLPPAVSNLAGTYDRRGQRREALPLVERLIRLQPDDASFWETRTGEGLLEIGAPVDAIHAFGRALEADPSNVQAVAMTARAYLLLGDHDRAQRWAELAFALQPDAIDTVRARALLAVQRKDAAAARAAFAPAFKDRKLEQLDFRLIAMRLAVALVLDLPEASAQVAEMHRSFGDYAASEESIVFGPWIALAQRRAKSDAAAKTLAAVIAFVEARAREGYQRGDWHYAAAQAHALSGRRAEALGELQRAMQRGWSDAWLARNDPTLSALREDPAFVALLSAIDAALAASRDALTKSPPKDWTPPAPPATFVMDAAALDSLAGNYVGNDNNNLIAVAREGAGISLSQRGSPTILLRPAAADDFVRDGSAERYRFVRGTDGRATHALGRALGKGFRLKRIEYVPPVPGPADRAKYKDYPGVYRFEQIGQDVAIRVDADKVWVQPQGQAAFEVTPERDDGFFLEGQALRLTFKRDAAGKVVALTINQLDADPVDGAKLP